MTNVLLSANTISPRPPLNVFEASRELLAGDDWYTLAEVPQYYIPQNGPNPPRTINTVAIMTGLTITNMHTSTIRVSARVKGTGVDEYYPILNSAVLPPNDFLSISFERQIMMSGESMEVSIPSNAGVGVQACAHFTYIVNQREEFTIIPPTP